MRSLVALENHDVLNLKPKEWLRVKSCQCQLQLSAYSLRFDLVNVLQWQSVQQLTPFSFNKDFSSKSQTLSNSLETFLIGSKKRRQRYWPCPAKHSYKWTQALLYICCVLKIKGTCLQVSACCDVCICIWIIRSPSFFYTFVYMFKLPVNKVSRSVDVTFLLSLLQHGRRERTTLRMLLVAWMNESTWKHRRKIIHH